LTGIRIRIDPEGSDLAMAIQKSAETQVPIHDLIGQRWSRRAFSETPVERDKLLALFEAAR